MNIDDQINQIREHRSGIPDSHAARYLEARGMAGEVRAALCNLQIATRVLAAAFDGELDDPYTRWMPYLEDKTRTAAQAAQTLGELASMARELPEP